MLMRKIVFLFILTTFLPSIVPRLDSAEGMWTFDNPPKKQLRELYGFVIEEGWLDHLRLSSVRFMEGGSGSLVSSDGLVITNHHVAIGQLQKMSTADQDFVKIGFYADTRENEEKCTDLEVNILQSTENVTDRVRAAIRKGMDAEQQLKAKEAEIAAIENESNEKTGLKPEVVSLYFGGEYWLYLYKKYTDVRLVMAPERQTAYYGGDSDNFTFPRFDLDMAFFRIYENGRPLQSPHYLKWNARGSEENELVFVSGHPGSTNRLYTVAQLEYLRDVQYPLVLETIQKRIEILHRYMKEGTEQSRRALTQLFGLENSKKALTGEYQGLMDGNLLIKKKSEEEALKKLVHDRSEWKKANGDAWTSIAKAVKRQRSRAREMHFRRVMGSRLYGIAEKIIFYSREMGKPDINRLVGFHASQLEELKFYLFSRAPIYQDLEEAVMLGSLKMSIAEIGPEDPFIRLLLKGKTPEEAVHNLIQGTNLQSVEFRRRLVEGGEAAVDTCTDAMIVLARELEPSARRTIGWKKKEIESGLSWGSEKIAQAMFAAYGKDRPPDATFSLRLSYGTVKGFPMNGTVAPCKTTLFGLYDRALSFNRQGDFELPRRYWDRRDGLDLATPVNFALTCDIIGGNSGSPVINRNAEFVGMIFDGNIESLPGRFTYDGLANRAVAVHSAYIVEALRKLYDAGKLADEIEGKTGQDTRVTSSGS